MTYSIAEVAKKTGLSVYTLRYYDKQGLMPYVDRSDIGNRLFKDNDLRWIEIIICLKKTGMKIKDIKQYIDYGMQGDSTTLDRLEILLKHKIEVEKQMQELEENMLMINKKINIYQKRLNES